MGNYDNYELQGAEREHAIAAIRRQIDAWGLTMPAVTPLVMHFGIGRFWEVGETEFWIANEREIGYCGKLIFVFDGQTCPYHHHEMKHETFYIVEGRVSMRVGDDVREMSAGDVLAMPSGVGHAFTGIGPALLLEVSLPSVLQDNFFADDRIGDCGVI
jgi:mannose-6-phosphate isomerase-like protein (cupin superfamily)